MNVSSSAVSVSFDLQGARLSKQETIVEVLASNNQHAVNSLDHPDIVVPTTKTISIKGKKLSLQPFSLSVFKIPVQ